MEDGFEVFISKETFKFNAAHFIAYRGFRERLHGHNYRLSLRVTGPVGPDGYVVDFGDLKRAAREVCGRLNEKTIVPMRSDVLDVRVKDAVVTLECEDGSRFVFPEGDCVLLPIVHSSAEELASYLCDELLRLLPLLGERGVTGLEVGVAEAPAQEARFRRALR